jgi:hypothetical protein
VTSRLLVPVLSSRNARNQHSPSRPISPSKLTPYTRNVTAPAPAVLRGWARSWSSRSICIGFCGRGSVAISSTGGVPCVALPLNCLEFLEREACCEPHQNRRPAGPLWHLLRSLATQPFRWGPSWARGGMVRALGPSNSRAVACSRNRLLRTFPRSAGWQSAQAAQNESCLPLKRLESGRNATLFCCGKSKRAPPSSTMHVCTDQCARARASGWPPARPNAERVCGGGVVGTRLSLNDTGADHRARKKTSSTETKRSCEQPELDVFDA